MVGIGAVIVFDRRAGIGLFNFSGVEHQVGVILEILFGRQAKKKKKKKKIYRN